MTSSTARKETVLALALCALAFLATTIIAHPVVMVAVALVPILLVIAAGSMSRPFELCLMFVLFSFFRIHEAFPVLNPLRIPSLLAVGALAALGWNMFFRKTITPIWPPQLIIFLVFFVHMTIGLPFAGDRPGAIAYWTATYSKIAIMTVAIAWLTRETHHFRMLILAVVTTGMAIAFVAIYNKLSGIGLVEGTRVTIGRDISSGLGDPNDLSLVLLFPMAFATSLAVTTGLPKSHRALGMIAIPILTYAVVATQSRGGLMGSLAIWGIVANNFIKQKSIIVGAGLLGATIMKFAAGIADRQSGGAGENGVDESAMGRIYAWQAAWGMALAHPFVGVGLNNFIPNYFYYSPHWDGTPHAVHSTWFVVVAEGCFPGIALFLCMVAVTTISAIKSSQILLRLNAPAPMRAMGMALVAGLGGFCISGTFLTQGYTWPIYIQVGLVSAISRYAQDFAANYAASIAADEHVRKA